MGIMRKIFWGKERNVHIFHVWKPNVSIMWMSENINSNKRWWTHLISSHLILLLSSFCVCAETQMGTRCRGATHWVTAPSPGSTAESPPAGWLCVSTFGTEGSKVYRGGLGPVFFPSRVVILIRIMTFFLFGTLTLKSEFLPWCLRILILSSELWTLSKFWPFFQNFSQSDNQRWFFPPGIFSNWCASTSFDCSFSILWCVILDFWLLYVDFILINA